MNSTKYIFKIAALLLGLFSASYAQVINTKETLNITIKGVPSAEQARISGDYVVSGNGYIHMPMLQGGIKASGISSSTLARKIEGAYRAAEIYTMPRITVISRKDAAENEIDAKTVTIGGFVKRPGPVKYMRGMTLFQAVAAAGGETAFGSLKRVELMRRNKRYVYNLRLLKHRQLKVYPGDSINVPQKRILD